MFSRDWDQLKELITEDRNCIPQIIQNMFFYGFDIAIFNNIITEFNYDINVNRHSLLIYCLGGCNHQVLQHLIDLGIDFQSPIGDYVDEELNPLTYICDREHSYDAHYDELSKCIEILLKNGIDPNCDGGDAFIFIMEYGLIDLVKLFIDYGVDVTIQENRALYQAFQQKKIPIIKLLIDHGANINDINSQLFAKKSPYIDYLVDLGLDPINVAKLLH